MEKVWKFEDMNGVEYGFGTQEQAEAYQEQVNAGRDVNCISLEEAEDQDRDDVFVLDDAILPRTELTMYRSTECDYLRTTAERTVYSYDPIEAAHVKEAPDEFGCAATLYSRDASDEKIRVSVIAHDDIGECSADEIMQTPRFDAQIID